MHIFGKTRSRIAAKVTEPIRNAMVIAVSAFITALIALIFALAK